MKTLPAVTETQVRTLGREDPLDNRNSNPLQCSRLEFCGLKSLVGYSPRGRKASDRTERLTLEGPRVERFSEPGLAGPGKAQVRGGWRSAGRFVQMPEARAETRFGGKGEPGSAPAAHPSPRQLGGQEGGHREPRVPARGYGVQTPSRPPSAGPRVPPGKRRGRGGGGRALESRGGLREGTCGPQPGWEPASP